MKTEALKKWLEMTENAGLVRDLHVWSEARKELDALTTPTPEDVARDAAEASEGLEYVRHSDGAQAARCDAALARLRDGAARAKALEAEAAVQRERAEALRESRYRAEQATENQRHRADKAESDLAAARQEVAQERARVSAISDRVEVALTERDHARQECDDLRTLVATLEASVSGVEKALRAAPGFAATVAAATLARAESAEAREAETRKRLEAAERNVARLEAQVSDMEGAYAELESDVSQVMEQGKSTPPAPAPLVEAVGRILGQFCQWDGTKYVQPNGHVPGCGCCACELLAAHDAAKEPAIGLRVLTLDEVHHQIERVMPVSVTDARTEGMAEALEDVAHGLGIPALRLPDGKPEPTIAHATLAAVVEVMVAETKRVCGTQGYAATHISALREVLRRATGGQVPRVLLESRVVEVLTTMRATAARRVVQDRAGSGQALGSLLAATDHIARELNLSLDTPPLAQPAAPEVVWEDSGGRVLASGVFQWWNGEQWDSGRNAASISLLRIAHGLARALAEAKRERQEYAVTAARALEKAAKEAHRLGQEEMRERAAVAADDWGRGTWRPVGLRALPDAIRSLPLET